jgi:hypothetical protein
MIISILLVLSGLIAVFLIMIAIQLIHIEKEIEYCTDMVEIYVKKLHRRA